MAINVRSAAQQEDGIIYVLTQEPVPGMPSPRRTKLARVGHRRTHGSTAHALYVADEVRLPKFNASGDGGADVLIVRPDSVLATDRTGEDGGGRLYHYTYAVGRGFTLRRSLRTGHHPRYTTSLANHDVVSCNLNDGSVSIFANLARDPDNRSIRPRRVATSVVKTPWFAIQLPRR